MDMLEGEIGPDKGGVKLVRHYGQSGYRDNWSGDLRITTEESTSVATIIFDRISERFTKVSGAWVPAKANGATLTETVANSRFLYRAADGKLMTY